MVRVDRAGPRESCHNPPSKRFVEVVAVLTEQAAPVVLPEQSTSEKLVRHFRQILLWPLQLMPIREGAQIQNHWELLRKSDNPWQELEDEFTSDASEFQERHYTEFVTFLPYVQRFFYGEGKGSAAVYRESPIRIFRRCDVAKVRMTYPYKSCSPIVFNVAHIDLYFFYDIDVTILAVEIYTDDIPLTRAQETLFRFGRAYPTYWKPDGNGGHCLERAEWLAADGSVLAVSDYEQRAKYLAHVCQHRAPCIASHWEFLLQPLVPHHSSEKGLIRYRQVENHRMPVCAYLALDDPGKLSRADFMRLALLTAPGPSDSLPYSEVSARDFEARYCYDRFWQGTGDRPGTRYMCCGYAFVMVGDTRNPFFVESQTGLLGQFRHQYFCLFLIPQLHKAALLMLSDRLVDALNRLDILNPDSVKRFKRVIRNTLETFLRFTHRYWFHEVSDQVQARELYRMTGEYLGTEHLYNEVKDEISDMSDYLDSDSLRRQANTVVRLTVVTTFGLIGTVTTGFLGMNLIAEAEADLMTKIYYFMLVFIPTIALTIYTIVKAKRLSEFLEAVSDERLSMRVKWKALFDVWRRKPARG
jgi:hypothetical protein